MVARSRPDESELTLEDLAREPSVYLIPECESGEEVRKVLRELCEEIFNEQLDGWYRDEASWPEDRSFKVFRRWFDFEYHWMLLDLCDEPLIREP